MSLIAGAKPTCPLRKDAARCIQRQNWSPQPRECRVCDFYGRKAADEAQPIKPAIASAIAPAIKPVPRETIQQKKEEVNTVPEAKPAREKVLSRIQKEKACNRGRLMNYCGLSSTEVDETTAALEKDGLIKSWRVSERSVIYTLPDAPDPRPATTGKNQQQPARTARKAAPAPPKKIGRLTEKKVPAAAGSPPPKNGGGRTGVDPDAIAAALAELRRRHEITARAILALEEMTT